MKSQTHDVECMRVRTQCASGSVVSGAPLPTSVWHHVEVSADGSCCAPDCPTALAEAAKIAVLVRLGHGYQPGWCGSFIALYLYGIPDIVAARGELGAWRDLYIRYESVRAIVRRLDDVTRERDRPHEELFRQARHAFRRCYLRDHKLVDINSAFHPCVREPRLEIGNTVSLYPDCWNVPLSPTWLADVFHLGIDTVGQRMILGVNPEHPGFVYAIDRDHTAAKHGFDTYVVREFYYNSVTRTLGAIASEKTA